MKVNKQNGITLTVLVITIAILLILAGVTINAAFGKNGLMKSAGEMSSTAKQTGEQKNQETNELIEGLEDAKTLAEEMKVAKIGKIIYKSLQDAINAVPEDNKQTKIILLKDIKENVIIKENQNIILDCQNQKIENKENGRVIDLSGKLIITNGNLRKRCSKLFNSTYSEKLEN